MNRHVNSIAGRLSLRKPQHEALEILDRVTEIVPPRKDGDIAAALEIIQKEYPHVTDFERDFPSLCFALATGVGKTRLMGAFISYLHLAHGLNHFFVLAPNLTIYNKLIRDFTPNSPKYVFSGIAEFALNPPAVVTGENYEQGATTQSQLLPGFYGDVQVNIFNISKINSEVRGGRAPRIKRLSEYLGESYFEYLAELPDLVLLMDESHRYRASAGIRAINELKPVLGLELTATPFVESARGPKSFKNVILDYPLGQAMIDGFVKEPAVVTRRDFHLGGMAADEIEKMKLDDGIRLHESVKVDLETYARENGREIVKPFMLIIARDTTHAGQLMRHIQSEDFFGGAYAHKVIQVDSSRTGAEEEAMIERLLNVEKSSEPTEIVIHVNMLKEGWDVTNLYTIVPLRAANARILIEQSIGRGLRLPYGKRTGVPALDRLSIVAHDRFQEIVDEAGRPGSTVHLQKIVLDSQELSQRTETVVSVPRSVAQIAATPAPAAATPAIPGAASYTPLFSTPAEREVARLTVEEIQRREKQPEGVAYILRAEVQASIVREVKGRFIPTLFETDGAELKVDFADVVAKTAEVTVQGTIDIPRIVIVPRGEVRSGFRPFHLETSGLTYRAPSDELWSQYLRTGEYTVIGLAKMEYVEQRLEDYIVSGLIDFNDISYDDHAELLYDLAAQVVRHFESYLEPADIQRVLAVHHRDIARFVHAQMQQHYWEEAVGYEARVNAGFTTLKPSAYTRVAGQPIQNYRTPPADPGKIKTLLFGGFQRCLYAEQKFQSDPERKIAVILERDSLKWFRPALGQFQIFYRSGGAHPEYQPDFVAETTETIYMIESKAANQMQDPDVLAKRDAAVQWCAHATAHTVTLARGKPWRYLLIPHNAIAENHSLAHLAQRYTIS